jgi:NAD(P)H dehydrogenase (quinone)
MRYFLDQTGALWSQNAFVGKVGSAFTSSATQHGGQETTLISFYITLLHLGMVIVGLPYTENRQTTMSEISGGSPYGVSSISGASGGRMPSANELAMARFQGKHVTDITCKLVNSNVS